MEAGAGRKLQSTLGGMMVRIMICTLEFHGNPIFVIPDTLHCKNMNLNMIVLYLLILSAYVNWPNSNMIMLFNHQTTSGTIAGLEDVPG